MIMENNDIQSWLLGRLEMNGSLKSVNENGKLVVILLNKEIGYLAVYHQRITIKLILD